MDTWGLLAVFAGGVNAGGAGGGASACGAAGVSELATERVREGG